MEFWSSFSRPSELPFIRVGAMRDARYMKDDGTPLSSEEAFTSLLNLQKYILEYKLGNMAPTLVRKVGCSDNSTPLSIPPPAVAGALSSCG